MVALWFGTQAAAMQPTASPSESPSTDSTTVASPNASGGASSIDLFTWGNLATVLLLVGGGAYALYLRQQYGNATGSTSLFQPLGQMTLGQSKHLRLVECGGEVLLLGVTNDGITLLKTYPRDAFEDLEAGDVSEDVSSSMGNGMGGASPVPQEFSDVLERFVQRDPQS